MLVSLAYDQVLIPLLSLRLGFLLHLLQVGPDVVQIIVPLLADILPLLSSELIRLQVQMGEIPLGLLERLLLPSLLLLQLLGSLSENHPLVFKGVELMRLRVWAWSSGRLRPRVDLGV